MVFGLLALSQPNPFFEFFRIFLTWVNRVLEIFLYLRIQVEINIATGRREQWAEVLGPEKRKPRAASNNAEVETQTVLSGLGSCFL